MWCSRDLLFQHIPKTAGVSVINYLSAAMPGPHYLYEWHKLEDGVYVPDELKAGDRHPTLGVSFSFAKAMGFTDIKRVFCIFRNPYATEVSMYHYIREKLQDDPRSYSALAKSGDFTNYIKHNTHWPSYEYFLRIGGELYDNMMIFQLEVDFPDNIKRLVKSLGGNTDMEFPYLNTTVHEPYETYYTAETEEIVYKKYQWVFDRHYYERMVL